MKLEVTATELQTQLCILYIFIFIYPHLYGFFFNESFIYIHLRMEQKRCTQYLLFCWRLLSLARLLPIIPISVYLSISISIGLTKNCSRIYSKTDTQATLMFNCLVLTEFQTQFTNPLLSFWFPIHTERKK